jgi:hypothetical protein
MPVTALAAMGSLARLEIGEHTNDQGVVLPEVIFIPAPIGRHDVVAGTDFPSQPR